MKTESVRGRTRYRLLLIVVLCASFGGTLQAQSSIDVDQKYAWAENVGWLNWRDANGGMDGVVVNSTHLSGFVWGENIGWINLGDGTPGLGTSYQNLNGSDFGVNIGVDGALSGYGWGENVGWINFDTASAGVDQAVFDSTAGRFRGYAWGENIGWINLDDATRFVGVIFEFSRGDSNLDGTIQIDDAFVVLDYLFAGGAPGCLQSLDYNDDDTVSISDAVGVLCFLFCPGGAPPQSPYPDCGPDPSPGALSCGTLSSNCP